MVRDRSAWCSGSVPVADRLDRLQRRHRAAGFPIAVVYKYVDDTGPYLAALITYYAFISLFPLLLLFTTILGHLLAGADGTPAPPVARDGATAAVTTLAAAAGAWCVRVHDVAGSADAVRVAAAWSAARRPGTQDGGRGAAAAQ